MRYSNNVPEASCRAVANKLDEMVLAAIKSPEYVSRAAALGLGIDPVSHEKCGEMLAAETRRWEQLIDSAKMTSSE